MLSHVLTHAFSLILYLTSPGPIDCSGVFSDVSDTIYTLNQSPTDINVEVAADLSEAYSNRCSVFTAL